jgi:hypothetical protein
MPPLVMSTMVPSGSVPDTRLRETRQRRGLVTVIVADERATA